MTNYPSLLLLADSTSPNVRRWKEGLEAAGAQVHLVTLHPSEGAETLAAPALPGKLRYFAAVPAARRLIRALQPDLVIAYFVTGYGTLGKLSGFHPLVLITAGEDVLLSPRKLLMRRLVRFNLQHADLIVAWAPHMADAVRALGIPDSQIMIQPRGIPLDIFGNIRIHSPQAETGIRIVSTRSLRPEYKLDTLIRAFRILADGDEKYYSLTLIGSGSEHAALEALVHELELDQSVQFAGRVSNSALPPILAQHHLYVSLYGMDGVSASLLEAMAVGLTPITFDFAANRYWVTPGENGLFVNSLDPAHIASVIQQAAGDLPLRQRAWQQNPRIVSERADLYRNTALYLDRFKELIAAYKAR